MKVDTFRKDKRRRINLINTQSSNKSRAQTNAFKRTLYTSNQGHRYKSKRYLKGLIGLTGVSPLFETMATLGTETEAQEYFHSKVLPVFQKALEWDHYVCMASQTYCAYNYSYACRQVRTVVVGSIAEGGATPRAYFTPPILEVDFLNITNLHWMESNLTPVPDKVGVYTDNRKKSQIPHYPLQDFQKAECLGVPKYLHQFDCDYHNNHKDYTPKWFLERLDQVEKGRDVSGQLKGPSVQRYYIPSAKNDTLLNEEVHFDNVFAGHYNGWPKEASEWKHRTRHWPSQDLVEEVLQTGYLIIPKLNDNYGGGDTLREVSVTFTLAERILARNRTPVQKMLYLMAKTIFYSHLDIHHESNPKVSFPSYALKTCMMWLMEQTPEDQWTEANMCFLLMKLFKILQEGTESGTLSNYFMSEANVLQNCPKGLLRTVSDKLQQITSELVVYLTSTPLFEKCIRLTEEEMERRISERRLVAIFNLQKLLEKIHTVKGTLKQITNILTQGCGDGLHAKGYTFNAEECFDVLKTTIQISTELFMRYGSSSGYAQFKEIDNAKLGQSLSKHIWSEDQLISQVFNIKERVPKHQIAVLIVHGEIMPDKSLALQIQCLPSEVDHDSVIKKHKDAIESYISVNNPGYQTDVLLVCRGSKCKCYKMSSLEGLVEYFYKELQSVFCKWAPKLYSLTHRESEGQLRRNVQRMVYLLYRCEDKVAPE